MKFADSVKQAASLTSTATIVLGAASPGFRALAQAMTDSAGKPEQVAVGDVVCMRVEDAFDASKWEIGSYMITGAAALTRQSILASSNGGGAVTFGGTVSVLCTVPSAHLARVSVDSYPSFSQSVPLAQIGTAWMPQYTVTGPLAFTPAAGAVIGAFASIPFVHDGASAITFPGFTQHGSSIDFISGAGAPWNATCWYDGVKYWYQLSQAAAPVAVDTIAPTIGSAAVGNSTPTIVTLAASEALDPNYTPAASAFTVGGHTVNGVAVAGNAVNLTVSGPFVNGEAARTVNYAQPGTAGLRDQSGNLMASFGSPLAITNGVQPVDVTPPTVSSAQVANASPSVVQVTMSETLAASTPPASAFAVSGGKTVSSVSITGTVVSLTCSAAYANGDAITVTYTAPATNPRLQDAAGNATASFGPVGVTNNVASVSAYPRFGSLTRVTESGAGPFGYVGSGAGFGFGGTEGDSVLTKAFQPGVNGSVIIKLLNTPQGGGTDECLIGVDPSGATGKQYSNIAYAVVGHASSYAQFSSGQAGYSPGVGATGTDQIKIERAGSTGAAGTAVLTFYLSKDGGATFPTTIGSWSGVSTGTLYVHVLVTGAGSFSPLSLSGLA